MINVADILGKTFSRSFRGVDPEEVDHFLREVAELVNALRQETARLQEELAGRDATLSDLRKREETFHQALQQAQDSGAQTMESARKEAQLTLQQAELKAVQIVEQARADLAHLNETITILRARKESIASRLKMLLHSELTLIKSLEAEGAGVPVAPVKLPEARAAEISELEDIIRKLDENP